jgi:hypothetical protein
MLISHRKQFIFIKTARTGGTSVELYFEPYCMPEGEWTFSHAREQYVSKEGIIGYRGPNKSHNLDRWRNHLSAKQIKEQIGDNIWTSYFKFTVVRNPFERLISQFYMQRNKANQQSKNIKKILKSQIRKLTKRDLPVDHLLDKDITQAFKKWVIYGGGSDQSKFYMINNEFCIDFFIRNELMFEDIKKLCKILDIPFEPDRLPNLKSTKNKLNIESFYDKELIDFVFQKYQHEIDYFGYNFPGYN